MPVRLGRRVGVDVGDVRIGVAVCDPDGMLATPLETVPAGPDAMARLAAIVAEQRFPITPALVDNDPPSHSVYRKLASRAFTPGRLRAVEPAIRALCEQLVDAFAPRGEVELAIHSLTEIAPVQGVTIVGPLPPELQKTTIYSGVVMKGAKHPVEARALLDYLASPEGRKAFLDRGYTAP